jgi:methylated-DNA-protein-cysteine methyltransferase related protein
MAKKQIRERAVQRITSAVSSDPLRRPREAPAPKRDFFQDVMDVVRQIPKGRVTSYGAIAKYLGAARSARIVGYCMNNAHVTSPPVPAHRVVNSSGLLTGKHHFPTPTRMAALLRKEGVKVKDDQVVDFRKKFWDPAVELWV